MTPVPWTHFRHLLISGFSCFPARRLLLCNLPSSATCLLSSFCLDSDYSLTRCAQSVGSLCCLKQVSQSPSGQFICVMSLCFVIVCSWTSWCDKMMSSDLKTHQLRVSRDLKRVFEIWSDLLINICQNTPPAYTYTDHRRSICFNCGRSRQSTGQQLKRMMDCEKKDGLTWKKLGRKGNVILKKGRQHNLKVQMWPQRCFAIHY